MKKVFLIISIVIIILLLGFGLYYFFGGGKKQVDNFFSDNSFGSFFDTNPKSQNDIIDIPLDVPEENDSKDSTYFAPIVRQISFEPISGYTYYSTTSTSTRNFTNSEGLEVVEDFISTSTVIRFQERATGHIYDVFDFIEIPQKISNITHQKNYITQFSSDKNEYIISKPTTNYEQITTSYFKLNFSTTTNEITIDTKEISNSISDFILNPLTNKLIYSIKQNGVSGVYTSNLDRTNEKLIKTLYFNEFLLDYINSTEVVISTKSSYFAQGYAYLLNTSSGAFSKLLGDIKGLLIKVSQNKQYYLYSQSEQNRPSLRLYSVEKNETTLITFDTLPSEKCVFSTKEPIAYCFGSLIYKPAQYPDDWYKGKIFNDENLYKINLTDGSSSILYNFTPDELSFDAINIKLTPDDSILMFENKKDLTLWSLNLKRLSNELN